MAAVLGLEKRNVRVGGDGGEGLCREPDEGVVEACSTSVGTAMRSTTRAAAAR